MARVGVLLLMHGDLHVNIWTDWATSDPDHPIALYALCDDRSCQSFTPPIKVLRGGPTITPDVVRACKEAIKTDLKVEV
eukprot:24937-Eustigmatos_ZCMA.PRE.1